VRETEIGRKTAERDSPVKHYFNYEVT